MTKKKKKIIFIIALVIIVVGVASYLLYSSYENKSKMIDHKSYNDIEENYWKSAEKVIKDQYVNKVASYITVKDTTTPFPIVNFVFPSKIDGKMLDTLKPEDLFREYCKMYSQFNRAPEENDEVMISIYGDKFIKVKGITHTSKQKIEYKENNNEITFKNVGDAGYYIVELEVNKADIFYLVF